MRTPLIFLCTSLALSSPAQRTAAEDSLMRRLASVLAPMDTTLKTKKYKPQISGVIQAHFLEEFNTNGDTIRDPDGFRILRARLTAKGKVAKGVSYVLMVDARPPEPRGFLRDAYISFSQLKGHEIRVGQQKTQFGWENRQSITDLYTVNRAEMSDAVSRGENLRDIGVGIIGHITLNKKWRVEDAVTYTNGTRSNVAGPYDFNTKKALWGRVGLRYKKEDVMINVGGSFGTGGIRYLYDDVLDPSDDVYATFHRLGMDVQAESKRFFFAAEYGAGTDMVKDTLFNDPKGYQALLLVKTKWKIGPLARYDAYQDEWSVWTFGAYYGEKNAPLRVLVNYMVRSGITDVPQGHDDRLYIQMQVVF